MSAARSSSLLPSPAVRTMKPPGIPACMDLQDALQAQALLVAGDLARDAGVLERRHVDHVSAGQRDVRRDARALLAERLLGDLDDDLLAFLQQFGDGRQRRSLRAAEGSLASGLFGPGRTFDGFRGGGSFRRARRLVPILRCRPDPPPRILRRMRRGMRCGNRPPCSRTCADSGGVTPGCRRLPAAASFTFGQTRVSGLFRRLRVHLFHGTLSTKASSVDHDFDFRFDCGSGSAGAATISLTLRLSSAHRRVVRLLNRFLGDLGQRLSGIGRLTSVSCRSRISSSSASSSG